MTPFRSPKERRAAFAKKGTPHVKPRRATHGIKKAKDDVETARVAPHGGKAVLLHVPGEGPCWFAQEDPELVNGEPSLVVAAPLPGGGPPNMAKPDNGWAYVGSETNPEVYHRARKLLGLKPDPKYTQDMGAYFDFEAHSHGAERDAA